MMPQKSLLFAETCYLSKKKKYYLDEWLKDFPSQWSGQEKGKIVCSRVTYLEFFRSGELLVVPRITMRDNKRNYVADTWWFVLCCVSFFSRSTSYIHEVRFNDTVCIYAYDISALRSRARARANTPPSRYTRSNVRASLAGLAVTRGEVQTVQTARTRPSVLRSALPFILT